MQQPGAEVQLVGRLRDRRGAPPARATASSATRSTSWSQPRAGSDRVFVSDQGNGRIQRFSTAGAYQLQWGTPGSGNGEFSSPSFLARDASSNIYVTDQGNHRVQKFTSAGVYSTQWGVYGTEDGNFQYPYGITFGSSSIYVSDSTGRIQKFSTTGTFQLKWGATTGSGAGRVHQPLRGRGRA